MKCVRPRQKKNKCGVTPRQRQVSPLVIFMREVPHNVITLVKNVVDLRKVLRKLHAHLGSAIRSFQSRSLSLREFAEKTLENLRKKLRQKVTKNATKSAE